MYRNIETANTDKTANNINSIQEYGFEKNVFMVKPVFKNEANDNLGDVLLRLMLSNKEL